MISGYLDAFFFFSKPYIREVFSTDNICTTFLAYYYQINNFYAQEVMHFTIWIFKTVLSHWPLFCKGYLTISWSVEVQIKLWKRRCKEVIFSYFLFPFFPTFAKFQDLSRLFQYLFLKERPFMDKAHQSMHVNNNGGKPKRTRSSKNPNTITFKEFDWGGGGAY